MKKHLLTFLFVNLMAAISYAQAPNTLTRYVYDSGNTYTLNLVKESLRGPNFNVKVQNADGSYNDYTPGEVRTYIGSVAELPDTLVVGYLQNNNQLWALMLMDRGRRWEISGTSVIGKSFRDHTYNWATTPTVTANQAGNTVYYYEIGLDVDYDCFSQRYSSNVATTVEFMERNMCEWKGIQLRDNMMQPAIGRVVIRASQARCPYQGLSGTAMLSPFRSEWINNQADARIYCFKSMLVTPNIGGGVAYMPGEFTVNQCRAGGYFMIVGRHELGHNFGASDWEANSPEGPTLLCGNGLARFCGPSVRKHLNHRNSNIGSRLYSIGGPYNTVNIPPYAALDLAKVLAETGQQIQVVVDVLANDFDANANQLSIISFDGNSSQGFPVTRSVGTGPNGRDQLICTIQTNIAMGKLDYFHYKIQDSGGMTATGLVLINIDIKMPELWSVKADADSYVQGTGNTANFGSSSQLVIKRSSAGAGSQFTRTAWVHFTLPYKPITSNPSLIFSLDSGDISSGTVTVWGIKDGRPGDNYPTDWRENTINGANAPQKPDFTENENITVIGTFAVSSTTDNFVVSGSALRQFLIDDTNGQVTFVLTRNQNDGNFALQSRENSQGGAPTLSMAMLPPADAYVRNGSYASDNYGSSNILIIKNDGSSYTRQSILRFDYSNKGKGDVTSALLHLTPLGTQPARLRIRLADDADDNWKEDQINWNTMPALSGQEIIFNGSSLTLNQPNIIDITTLLNQSNNKNQVATLVIDAIDAVQHSYTSFASKEYHNFALRPRLDVVLEDMYLIGDFNFDNKVDLLDFAIFAGFWLDNDCSISMSCNGTDLNNDNTVDLLDLKLLLDSWLQIRN